MYSAPFTLYIPLSVAPYGHLCHFSMHVTSEEHTIINAHRRTIKHTTLLICRDKDMVIAQLQVSEKVFKKIYDIEDAHPDTDASSSITAILKNDCALGKIVSAIYAHQIFAKGVFLPTETARDVQEKFTRAIVTTLLQPTIFANDHSSYMTGIAKIFQTLIEDEDAKHFESELHSLYEKHTNIPLAIFLSPIEELLQARYTEAPLLENPLQLAAVPPIEQMRSKLPLQASRNTEAAMVTSPSRRHGHTRTYTPGFKLRGYASAHDAVFVLHDSIKAAVKSCPPRFQHT